MEVLSFVSLANGAALDMIPDQAVGMGVVEGRPKPMQGLLHTFMTGTMCGVQDLRPDRRGRGHEDAPSVHDETVHQGP